MPAGAQAVIVARLRAAGCVFAEDEARLLISEAGTSADLDAMVERRASGLPLEHVIGSAEFCGLRIAVSPGVFVPRRRTEFLVRQAVALVANGSGCASVADQPGDVGSAHDDQAALAGRANAGRPPSPGARAPGRAGVVVVDLCCGSGAVGAALAARLGPAELHAVDIDAAAVRCARRNVCAAGGRVYQGDLYQPLPAALRGRVDILVANVPYVPSDEVALLPPEARLHEPRVALDGGADGLDVLRRVAAAAPAWLAPGGHLLMETSGSQAPRAVDVVSRAGLVPRVAASEELGATVIIAAGEDKAW